jgi:hypothetical protein
VFRVRNRVNGLNETNYELTAPGVVATEWQHVVAAYDHGISTVYVNATARATIDLREPTVYYWLAPNALARAALIILAVITLSLPATFVFRALFNFHTACSAAVTFTFLAGILPYLINCCGLDALWPLHFVGPFLIALTIYPIGLLCIVRLSDFRGAAQNYGREA